MSYRLPFNSMQAALYKVLSTMDIGWFDSGVSITEIEDYYKGQGQIAYGVIGAADADANVNKDKTIWSVALDLEVYSNYKGRKHVIDTLEAVVNLLDNTSSIKTMNERLNEENFTLVDITIGNIRVNLPIYGDSGVWQSGATTLTFRIGQGE